MNLVILFYFFNQESYCITKHNFFLGQVVQLSTSVPATTVGPCQV